jgi:arylformamidase
MSGWIDVSVPLRSGMLVWDGDDSPRVEQTLFLERGDPYNLTSVAMSVHTGTHMDAPLHFIRGGASIDAIPLEAVIGEARVIESHDAQAVRASDLPNDLPRGARVLFKTRNSLRDWPGEPFDKDFVYISREAAQALVDAGVRTVGIDYLSVGGFANDLRETHEILLGAGVWVIEGLDLRPVEAGRYQMVCLPLKIAGAEGAPARVALKRLD